MPPDRGGRNRDFRVVDQTSKQKLGDAVMQNSSVYSDHVFNDKSVCEIY